MLTQREIIIILVSAVVVFLILWRVAGYFAHLYLSGIQDNINKLFDLIDEIKNNCRHCERDIGELKGKSDG